jgi:flagellar protein FlbD
MIHVTRINQQPLVLNSDLIEQIEATPDTVITMTNGQKLVIADSAQAVIEKIVTFRRLIHQVPCSHVSAALATEK